MGEERRSIADMARDFGISAWDRLSPKQVAKILELAGKAKISELEIEKIIEISKVFAPIAASVLQTIQTAASGAAANQARITDQRTASFETSLDALRLALGNMESDEGRAKVAQMIADLAREELEGLERMNRSNNAFWTIFSAIVASLAAALALTLRVAR